MTNPHDDAEFWEDIKSKFISRQKEIDELSVKEIEALNDLRDSSESLSESVAYFLDLEYDDLVLFVGSTSRLLTEFNWNPFERESEGQRSIVEKSIKLASFIEAHDGRLSLRQVNGFGWVCHLVSTYLDCRPNKYQMKRFDEFGITWEGEVRDN